MSLAAKANILISGDICPTASDQVLFENAQIDGLVDEGIRDVFASVDYRICNLETVLTERGTKLRKHGPCLSASLASINALIALGIDFACLSNNHIMDYGCEGAKDTIAVLEENNIAYSGIGKNEEIASNAFFFQINGIKIGILCCCEHEFSTAGRETFGAYAFDPLYTPDLICELKKNCDFLLVLYHGGKELYRYPSPQLRRVCMKCVDKGADLIICQHSHCIGSEQVYRGKKIIYGQGNFLFNRKSDEFWDTGLLVLVTISQNGHVDYKNIPIVNKNGKKILATGSQKDQIEAEYTYRSSFTNSADAIENIYDEFSTKSINLYLKSCLGRSLSAFSWRILSKLSRSINRKWFFGLNDILRLENHLECEAHRELFISGLHAIRSQNMEDCDE